MARWRLKSCPRCGGDIFIDRDLDNWYEQCLQCSYRVDLKTLVPIKSGFKESVPVREKPSNGDDKTEE